MEKMKKNINELRIARNHEIAVAVFSLILMLLFVGMTSMFMIVHFNHKEIIEIVLLFFSVLCIGYLLNTVVSSFRLARDIHLRVKEMMRDE